MNPYRAKIVKEKDSLMAAKKTLWEGMHGHPMPERRLKLHAPDNYSTPFDVYKKRVELVRGMPDEKVGEMVQERALPKILGFDNDSSWNKSRKQHSILVAAGKLNFSRKESLNLVREIYETGALRKETKSREGPIVNMLHIAGIIGVKTMKNGRREIKIKDRERLKRVLREKRIVW